MPITYGPDTSWPPTDLADLMPSWREWSVWYRGKPDELARFYVNAPAYIGGYSPSQQRIGGITGWLNRLFWGRLSTSGTTKLHVPAAADVASLSAAMLFADPPVLQVPEAAQGSGKSKTNPTQDRLDTVLQEAGVYAALHEAAERNSQYGSVYVRVSANAELADMPIVETIMPDTAIPEFYGPFLTGVTFFHRLTANDATGPVYRHLERHEMLGTGARRRCVVFHQLRRGTNEKLGREVPLQERPETARFAELVDDEGKVEIGTTVLDVVFVPNIKPHRQLPGVPFGRSDYDSVMPEMDALDHTWSSWMRDIRIGQGRLVVPRGYLRQAGNVGDGATFDLEQEIYSAINAQPGNQDSAQLAITPVQFAIRTAEHQSTADELWKIIYRGAGFDGTENSSENTPAETATGVNAKAGRKRSTRAVKIGYWTPALRRLARVLLELDAIAFRTPGLQPGAPIEVEWPDAAAPDPETVARTVQLLDAAGAVSQRTKIRLVHPDWDVDQVDEELAEMKGDAPPPIVDPADPNAPPGDNPQTVDGDVDDTDEDQT